MIPIAVNFSINILNNKELYTVLLLQHYLFIRDAQIPEKRPILILYFFSGPIPVNTDNTDLD